MRAFRSLFAHATRSRAILALVATTALLTVTARPAESQYIYLDANQNGIHDACDRLSVVGPTQFDVWLDTDNNRDGTPAGCTTGFGALDLDHYEIVLRASGGTVAWGPMRNRIAGATVNFCRDGRDSTDAGYYHNGWGGAIVLAPGTYKLATLTVRPLSGTPQIDIVNQHPLRGLERTAFGTQCPGSSQHDHSTRLGRNFLDQDGLGAAAAPAPVLTGPDYMLPQDGTLVTVDVTSTDPLGGAITQLTADLSGLPPGNDGAFVTAADLSSGSFTWTPTTSDAGDYVVTFVTVAGGCRLAFKPTTIHVIGTVTSVAGAATPPAPRLAQNRPNPFNPTTTIDFELTKPGSVRLAVFDARGALVRMLANRWMPAGPQSAAWDGTGTRGVRVGSGVYLYRLEAEGASIVRRMVLLR
jgi:hypothetical protein